mgnify:CR=1 FL=1
MGKSTKTSYSPAPRRLARAISDAEIVRDFLAPPSELKQATKRPVTIRLDADVVEWFKRFGGGYQTRINRVLRAYMDAQRERR